MSQEKIFNFTNPATAVAVNLDVGFTVASIRSIDPTAVTGGWFEWFSGMTAGSYLDGATGLVVATAGFTPIVEESVYGASISGFTNAAPGVLTVSDTARFGFAVGDTIKVAELADDETGDASLNGEFVIASLTATTITTTTDTSATGFSVYVSGRTVTRVSDVDGFSIPTQNFSIFGLTLGTAVVGGDDAVMAVKVTGENSVT